MSLPVTPLAYSRLTRRDSIAALVQPSSTSAAELHMLHLAAALAARSEAARSASGGNAETDVAWSRLRDWPEGVEMEEEAVKVRLHQR